MPFLLARWLATTILVGNLGATEKTFKTSLIDNQNAFSHEEKKRETVIIKLAHKDFI